MLLAIVIGLTGGDTFYMKHNCVYENVTIDKDYTAGDIKFERLDLDDTIMNKLDRGLVNKKKVLFKHQSRNGAREYSVHSSNVFANYFDSNIQARIFPHLFPFGLGHWGEQRRVPVHYPLDVLLKMHLVTFDQLSIRRALQRTMINCTRRPEVHASVCRVTATQVQIHPNNKEKFKNVELSLKLGKHRQRLFATADRHGQPHVFFTITPNTDDSCAIIYSTGNINLESLTHMDPRQLPIQTKIHQMAYKNGVAA